MRRRRLLLFFIPHPSSLIPLKIAEGGLEATGPARR
jgi:hypothetical protein